MRIRPFRPGRLPRTCGYGYFAGEPPASAEPDAPDGRAKKLNVPGKVRILVLERSTRICVGSVLSRANGHWRIGGLNPQVPYVVLGFDDSAQLNAAVQDWVRPEVYDPAPLRKLAIMGELPGGQLGRSVSWKLRAANPIGAVTFTVSSGSLPPGWIATQVDNSLVISGSNGATGTFPFEVTVEDSTGRTDARAFSPEVVDGAFDYRILVTANNGNVNYVTICEIEMRGSVGGVDQCVGGTASATSWVNSLNVPELAFDNNPGEKWASGFRPTAGAPQWIAYRFPGRVNVAQLAITGCIAGQTDMAPRDFLLQRSFNGASWETIASIAGQTGWTPGETRLFTI